MASGGRGKKVVSDPSITLSAGRGGPAFPARRRIRPNRRPTAPRARCTTAARRPLRARDDDRDASSLTRKINTASADTSRRWPNMRLHDQSVVWVQVAHTACRFQSRRTTAFHRHRWRGNRDRVGSVFSHFEPPDGHRLARLALAAPPSSPASSCATSSGSPRRDRRADNQSLITQMNCTSRYSSGRINWFSASQ